MPVLLTSMSRLPNASMVLATASAWCSASSHLPGTAMAPSGPPSSATAASSASALRAVTHTRAPCRTSSAAIPRPMPRLAPVTMATRSFSDSMCLSPAVRLAHGDRISRARTKRTGHEPPATAREVPRRSRNRSQPHPFGIRSRIIPNGCGIPLAGTMNSPPVARPGIPDLRQAHEAVGVAGGVGVEADDVTLVVHAVDGGGTGARVVHGRPLAVQPGEAVRDGVVAGPDGVSANDLAAVVDAERLGHRRAGHGERGGVAVGPLDEAVNGALGVGEEAGDRAGVVDRGGGQRGRALDGDRLEPAAFEVVRVAVGVALAVVVEPDRPAGVVDAEQLVDRRVGVVPGREVDLVEEPVLAPEPEVVVVRRGGAILGREEADGDAEVIEPGHLRLLRAGKILFPEITLRERGEELVSLVRLSGVAAAEVPGDQTIVVNAEKLIERDVTLVVHGEYLEAARLAVGDLRRTAGGRPGQCHALSPARVGTGERGTAGGRERRGQHGCA